MCWSFLSIFRVCLSTVRTEWETTKENEHSAQEMSPFRSSAFGVCRMQFLLRLAGRHLYASRKKHGTASRARTRPSDHRGHQRCRYSTSRAPLPPPILTDQLPAQAHEMANLQSIARSKPPLNGATWQEQILIRVV